MKGLKEVMLMIDGESPHGPQWLNLARQGHCVGFELRV